MTGKRELCSPDSIGNKDIKDSWDGAADEFADLFADDDEFYHKHIINPCLFDLLGNIEGKTILDLACGEGHFSRRLAERAKGNIQITGVDISENLIKISQGKE